MKKLERYEKKFDESYDYADKKVHIICVSLGGGNPRKAYLIGFKKEKNADIAVDYFDKLAGYTFFSVDNYGYSTIEEAENYFSKAKYKIMGFSITNTDVAINRNPKALVNQVYNNIK